ncbi:ribonuclease E/G [Sphingomonas sp. HDW15A]|uniref:ribonuclease E/G n=1 Tax=Sphingomonas sp. HDW15A TaxID=2714942 RepID=UPI0019D07CED|nr:ribonuclease E/G [Sphingomonas sp. HDW15A]
MSMRMLIDARHPEETRVAVVKGSRIEEFDFESAEHKQLKGNIYLAKVTRVEPSLQAAFIEYGGNRHGFLAFSEIHPDYYQIPKSDREALLREEAEHAAEEERLRAEAEDASLDPHHEDDGTDDRPEEPDDEYAGENGNGSTSVGTESSRSPVDESAADELRKKRQALRRRYKIQDVIQRRQVLLVQVVKEERGNKGAALTTYLSLAGRYCVLMPNTSHGGGISRKISNGADRKRLKSIMSDLKLPSTMGLIVRTAGLERTKTEIKRDFDYLARLWDEIREKTLTSSAPALIYRDSDLVKRAIRDLYNKEIDEVVVEGEDGYKAARGFMKLLMPSHVKRVRSYSDPTPIFQRFGVEDQLNAMYQPVVQLKSGGYLVINPTEALVSIDINSGRATREHNIEQTAFATNLEAASEIARQLRLRDMAGLVVIDFIDMEQNGHVRKVEKAMKEALKNDRARIQVGRISSFGLMEMSRQRLRTGVLEASTKACPHCEGTGLMRTASSAGLSALRIIEDEAARGRGDRIILRAGREAAIYLLNKKRAELAEIEARYGVTVEVLIDESLEGARMSVDSTGPRPVAAPRPQAPFAEPAEDDDFDDAVIDEDEDEEESGERERGERDGIDREGDRDSRKRRRRRRGGRGRNRNRPEDGEAESAGEDSAEEANDAGQQHAEVSDAAEDDGARRRRGRRGGRGRKPREEGAGAREEVISPDEQPTTEPVIADAVSLESASEADEEAPKTRRRPRARKPVAQATASPEAEVSAPIEAEASADTKEAKPKGRSKKAAAPKTDSEAATAAVEPTARDEVKPKARRSRSKKPETEVEQPQQTEESGLQAANADDDSDEPKRGGWWQRTFG